MRQRQIEYHRFYLSPATAHIEIEEFNIENPDQAKSVHENLIQKLLNGENAVAQIGKQYKIPVRVMDKSSRIPISGDFYYSSIQHIHATNRK